MPSLRLSSFLLCFQNACREKLTHQSWLTLVDIYMGETNTPIPLSQFRKWKYPDLQNWRCKYPWEGVEYIYFSKDSMRLKQCSRKHGACIKHFPHFLSPLLVFMIRHSPVSTPCFNVSECVFINTHIAVLDFILSIYFFPINFFCHFSWTFPYPINDDANLEMQLEVDRWFSDA